MTSVHDLNIEDLSQNRMLNKLLKNVVKEVKFYAEDQIKHIKQSAQIGLALSVEKNINRLLEMIVSEARALSSADAGTLYVVDKQREHLCFEILQNDTMNIRIGGTGKLKSNMPDVPLYLDGQPNYSNVSSYVALTGETVNIPDVYKAEGFDFTGPRNYDKSTGYRSKSMLVIPLKNHENDIIGVLQLLNSTDAETDEVISFSPEYMNLVASLASQAAVAMTNAQLIEELKKLFSAFIKSIATAIDEKSPYTGGHVNNMFGLTVMIAEKINETDKGHFKDIHLSDDEMEELKMAAWMHDVGKITTPEYIIDKATKLQTICDRIKLVETRFLLIIKSVENESILRKLENLKKEKSGKKTGELEIDLLDAAAAENIKKIQEELEFVKACNSPSEHMDDNAIKHLKEIGKKTYTLNGQKLPWLTEEEVENLCVQKGTLTKKERGIIENHARMTLKMLEQLPFPKNLANVPNYASAHHEKLDGSGYPRGLFGKDLPLQSRIMAIADVFEALTARDRPYKKPIKLSRAIKILEFMKKDKHIDPDILDLFIKSGVFYDYAQEKISSKQIDIKLDNV